MTKLWFALAVLCTMPAGCARKHPAEWPASAPAASTGPDFLDLQAGWRLRITTPLFPKTSPEIQEASAGNTVTLKAPEGFAYQTAYYEIRRDPARGLQFELISGTVMREGKRSDEPARLGWEIRPDIAAVLARVIYLRRLSGPDHNMAIAAAMNQAALEALTRAIDVDPERACVSTAEAFCAWVPPGVAVVAERMTANGDWEPVR